MRWTFDFFHSSMGAATKKAFSSKMVKNMEAFLFHHHTNCSLFKTKRFQKYKVHKIQITSGKKETSIHF